MHRRVVPSFGLWRLMALRHAEDAAPTVVDLSVFRGAKRATYREPKATEPPAKRRPLSSQKRELANT